MAFKQPDDKSKPPAPSPKPIPLVSDKTGKAPTPAIPKKASERLVSLDAYRGATMLFLASSGLGIQRLVGHAPDYSDFTNRFQNTGFGKVWASGWEFISGQLEHVAWTGCTAWDLIQPSFMFMVGVAMPFSYASRAARGDSWGKQLAHAVVRSLILILMGIFLRSVHSPMTHFTFEDVLTQIGLGYLFVFLLLRGPFIAAAGRRVGDPRRLLVLLLSVSSAARGRPRDAVRHRTASRTAVGVSAIQRAGGGALEQAHECGGPFRSHLFELLPQPERTMGRKKVLGQRRRLPDSQFHSVDGDHDLRRDRRPAPPQWVAVRPQAAGAAGCRSFVLYRVDGRRHDDLAGQESES